MTEEILGCCQSISRVTPTPFEIIQMGWYDGITEGLAKCRTCGSTYTFDVMVSSDGVRAYGFARIGESEYEAVATIAETSVPTANALQEWREAIALAAVRSTTYRGERHLLVVADDLEHEVKLATLVRFSPFLEFLERSADKRGA